MEKVIDESIKPCPFCGCSEVGQFAIQGGHFGSYVTCLQCEAEGPIAPDIDTAIAHWSHGRPRESVGISDGSRGEGR